MTGKFTLKLEGDAYADGLATADKFIETIKDRLEKIEELALSNLEAVDAIAEAVEELKLAKDALSPDE
jgi:hypothetical protein